MIKFFEGLSTFIFDLIAAEFRAADPRGRLAYALMRPGIDRIRDVFDYERLGGSPLLGVKGTVIITHGRAKRRMVGYARRRRGRRRRGRGSPTLIAEAFRGEPTRLADAARPPPLPARRSERRPVATRPSRPRLIEADR